MSNIYRVGRHLRCHAAAQEIKIGRDPETSTELFLWFMCSGGRQAVSGGGPDNLETPTGNFRVRAVEHVELSLFLPESGILRKKLADNLFIDIALL